MSGSQTSKMGQRKVRTEIFRLVAASLTSTLAQTTTGVTEGTYHCKAKLTSTGIFALQLGDAYIFARAPVVQATAEDASQKVFCVVAGNTSGGLITVNCFSDAGTATSPTAVNLTVTGSDAADQI